MTPRKPKTVPAEPLRQFCTVERICAADIGRMIRWYEWDARREVATVATAELRQISSTSAEVVLICGLGADREVTFLHGEEVVFEPQLDYSDVPELRQRFCDFHDITDDLP